MPGPTLLGPFLIKKGELVVFHPWAAWKRTEYFCQSQQLMVWHAGASRQNTRQLWAGLSPGRVVPPQMPQVLRPLHFTAGGTEVWHSGFPRAQGQGTDKHLFLEFCLSRHIQEGMRWLPTLQAELGAPASRRRDDLGDFSKLHHHSRSGKRQT